MNERTTPPLLLRRNGRPQACNPCRRRKLACDHTQPVCGRCRKRKQDAECVYLISGTTVSNPRSPLASPASSTSSSAQHGGHRHTQNASAVRSDAQAPSLARPGYLGPTSYYNIYEDTENSLSLLQGSESATPQSENVVHHAAVGESRNVMSSRVRDMCLTVLRSVPDPIQGSPAHFKLGSENWTSPIAIRAAESLYKEYSDCFSAGNRSTARLEELAGLICANTLKPFSDDEPDPDRWIDQFTGKNIRWETLGILSVFWEFVPGSNTKIWKGKRSAEFDRGFRIERENLHLCYELCKEFSAGNSMMLYISQRCAIIDSMVVGDANLVVWRTHAESVALMTFLGFHAVEEKDRQQVSFSTEIKKRLVHHMFVLVIDMVSFTGRPPLISFKYSSTPLPLDISNEDLFSDHDTFMKAVRRLDEKGWNTDGAVHACTGMRARAILIAIREEVFDIALSNAQAVSTDTLLQLRARELKAVSEFPDSLEFESLDLTNPEVPVKNLPTRLFVQLEHLQNMFFIERLLIRSGREDKGDLLKISYDLVTQTLPWLYYLLCGVNSGNYLYDRDRNNCEWLVMGFAVPAGGILCLELLKPTLHLRPHSDTRITRSNIIQKLSLLVAFLDWVSPSGPNGDLCSDAKSVIQRVLDQTLNAASSVYEPPALFEWDFSTQLDFNFDLLDTFDWNRPDFPSSQQSNQQYN